jgi:hypothetical protein
MPHTTRLILVAGLLLLQAPVFAQSPVTDTSLAVLARWMTGSFSSADQSFGDTNYYDIRLHMARIWPERSDGCWLYVEQAMAARMEKPYRQRVYRLSTTPAGYESAVFLIPDPLRFAGAWKDAEALKHLTPDSLIARAGCSILLERTADGSFAGSTDGHNCPSDLRGAAYATSVVSITDSGMVTWDRGFDGEGKQVWGATTGGYRFKKIQDH